MVNRSALVGVLLGVLLLGGLVGFAVGLPKWIDAEPERTPAVDLLPPNLEDGDLNPIGEVIPEAAEQNAELETEIADRQREVLGADYAFRYYASAELERIAAVTIADLEPGLFQPGGPPAELAEGQNPAGHLQQLEFGDVLCYAQWGNVEQIEASQRPSSVQCQRSEDGRTFELFIAGVTADDAAATLNAVVAHARSVG